MWRPDLEDIVGLVGLLLLGGGLSLIYVPAALIVTGWLLIVASVRIASAKVSAHGPPDRDDPAA